jgi:hypothetical protein
MVIGNIWGDRFTYTQMIGYFWVYLALALKAREFALDERAATTPDEPPVAARPAVAHRMLRGIRPAAGHE